MENIPIFNLASISRERCLNTKAKTLNKITNCCKCHNIPLPCLRSSTNQFDIYCKDCFDKQSFGNNHFTILPSPQDIQSLDKLVFSCEYENMGCLKLFKINTIEEMINHVKNCSFNSIDKDKFFKFCESKLTYEDINNKICKRCKTYELNGNHDCIENLRNSFANMLHLESQRISEEIMGKISIQLNYANELNDLKIKSLEEKFLNLNPPRINTQENSLKEKDDLQFKNDITIKRNDIQNENQNILPVNTAFPKNNFTTSPVLNTLTIQRSIAKNNFTSSPVLNTLPIQRSIALHSNLLQPVNEFLNSYNKLPEFEEKQSILDQLNNTSFKTLTFKISPITGLKNILLNLQTLENLNLEYNGKNIGDKGLENILGCFENLKTLSNLNCSFSCNNITETGVNSISKIIVNYSKITSLMIDLGSNRIGEKGAYILGDAISSLSNLKTMILKLSGNDIKDSGFIKLSQSISLITSINNMNLDFSLNMISDKGIISISEAFKNLKKAISITLNFCLNYITDIGLRNIANSLNKETLIYLYLQKNTITENCVKEIKKINSKIVIILQ